ncbi:MAG: VanZ family protein, partial [Candidatus Omnitrophica bacterium]|nr:VanZ family protein [Candidatus Omnitrophota bacterium]
MNNLKFWLPVYLYALFIFILSSIPKLPEIGPDFLNADKLLHIIEYGILGLLLARAFKNSSSQFLMGNFLILTCLVSCLYGITDEFHQS